VVITKRGRKRQGRSEIGDPSGILAALEPGSAGLKHILEITVEFGDCDPSGIVFHPNFFSWFDAGSLHFFRDCGIPSWRETIKTHGILGTPIVSTRCNFRAPARYGDQIEVHTCISEWRERRFTQHHQIVKGETLIAEALHVRVFAGPHPDDPQRIRALPIPPEFREMCDRKFPPQPAVMPD
jgi:4-hydroxybenzoyl-CoA thioesterase